MEFPSVKSLKLVSLNIDIAIFRWNFCKDNKRINLFEIKYYAWGSIGWSTDEWTCSLRSIFNMRNIEMQTTKQINSKTRAYRSKSFPSLETVPFAIKRNVICSWIFSICLPFAFNKWMKTTLCRNETCSDFWIDFHILDFCNLCHLL